MKGLQITKRIDLKKHILAGTIFDLLTLLRIRM